MADYNNSLMSAELASANNRNLVRGNSVATPNQIYQHQNCIPARNRLLSTAKSLQQSSMELLEPNAPAGQLNQVYLTGEPSRADELAYQAVSNPLGSPFPHKPPTQQQQIGQPAKHQHIMLLQQPLVGGQPIGSPNFVQSASGGQPMRQTGLLSTTSNRNQHPSQFAAPAVKIINVAKRHKKHSSAYGSQRNADLESANYERQPAWSSKVGQEGWSSDSSSCSSSYGTSPGRMSSAGPPGPSVALNNRQPSPGRSPIARAQTSALEVQHRTSKSAARTLSRSPSPGRSTQSSGQLICGGEPKLSPNHGQLARRRVLPQISAQATEAPLTQQVVEPPITAERPKQPRRLPEIPVKQQQQQQQQQPQPRRANQKPSSLDSALGRQPPPSSLHTSSVGQQPILKANSSRLPNKSLSSSSSNSSNSPLLAAQQPSERQQVRVPAYPMPCDQLEAAKSTASQQHSVEYAQRASAVNRFHSSGSGSTDTPSPHSPVPGSRQLGRVKPAAALNSIGLTPGMASHCFTFDGQQLEREQALEAAQQAANFVCYSPGGTRTASDSGRGVSVTSTEISLQLSPSMLSNTTELAGEQQSGSGPLGAPNPVAGRGRRLSSCGSGLRANFLMNKQHAISEFTPPRSLESSSSREWQQQASLGAPQGQSASSGGSPSKHQSPTHLGATSQSGGTRNEGSVGSRRGSPSSSQAKSLGGGQQCGRWGAFSLMSGWLGDGGVPAANVMTAGGQRRVHPVCGLPPRAASATETTGSDTKTGAKLELGGRLNPTASLMLVPQQYSQMDARSNQSAATGAPSATNRTASWNMAGQPTMTSYTMQPPASHMMNALSIDVYHCGSQRASQDDLGAGDSSEHSSYQTSSQHQGGYLSTADQQYFGAAAATNQQRSSLLIPSRDRQPSNVSTASMPVGSFLPTQLTGCPTNSPAFITSSINQQQVASSLTGLAGVSQVTGATAGGVQSTSGRKLGAWAERIAGQQGSTGASLSLLHQDGQPGRRAHSASQLGRTLSGGCHRELSSSASSSGVQDSSQLATKTSPYHSSPTSALSSSECSSSGSAGGRPRSRRPPKNRRRRKRSANPARGGATTWRRLAAELGGQSSAELTLDDRLKLAEHSAIKLFRKVDLSPKSQASSRRPGVASESSPRAQSSYEDYPLEQVLVSSSQQQQQRKSGAVESALADSGAPRGGGESHEFADDEQGDDLSLLLRSVDRQRSQEQQSPGNLAPERQSCEQVANQSGATKRDKGLRAVNVVRRAMTLRSLVKNLAGRRPSATADAHLQAEQAGPSPSRQLLAAAEAGASIQRRSAAECVLAPPARLSSASQTGAEWRPKSAESGDSQPSNVRRRAALFFRKAAAIQQVQRRSSSSPMAAEPANSKKQPADRSGHLESTRVLEGGKRMARMKSVITAVSRRLEPLRGMRQREKQQRAKSSEGYPINSADFNEPVAGFIDKQHHHDTFT